MRLKSPYVIIYLIVTISVVLVTILSFFITIKILDEDKLAINNILNIAALIVCLVFLGIIFYNWNQKYLKSIQQKKELKLKSEDNKYKLEQEKINAELIRIQGIAKILNEYLINIRDESEIEAIEKSKEASIDKSIDKSKDKPKGKTYYTQQIIEKLIDKI
jgi:hypothetical protein